VVASAVVYARNFHAQRLEYGHQDQKNNQVQFGRSADRRDVEVRRRFEVGKELLVVGVIVCVGHRVNEGTDLVEIALHVRKLHGGRGRPAGGVMMVVPVVVRDGRRGVRHTGRIRIASRTKDGRDRSLFAVRTFMGYWGNNSTDF